jgi:parvulin-like peptidyl-prolyl isomerase
MRRLFTCALLGLALLLAPAGAVRVSKGEVVDRIVAVINDGIITLSELNAAMALDPGALKDGGRQGERPEKLKSATLDRVIEQKLVKQASEKTGIDVSEREVDNAVEEVLDQNNLNRGQLEAELKKNGLTYTEYREQLREQIRQVKFIDMAFRSKISVSKEDIEDYYRQNIKEFYGPPTFRIRLILLSGKDELLQSMRLKAVTEGIGAGEEFKELAKQYSDDASSGSGGDLGYLGYGEIDTRLEKVAGELKPGEVRGPVTGPGGIYFIKLEERRLGEPIPLEKVMGLIHKRLFDRMMEEMYSSWLKDIKASAHIDIRL